MPTVLTSKKKQGDLLIAFFHQGFNFDSAKVKNAGGGTVTITDPLGYPLKTDGAGGYALALAADAANVIGLIISPQTTITLAAGASTTRPCQILARGPAVLDKQMLPTLDLAGAAITLATLVTALQALQIRFMTEPVTSSTQAT